MALFIPICNTYAPFLCPLCVKFIYVIVNDVVLNIKMMIY